MRYLRLAAIVGSTDVRRKFFGHREVMILSGARATGEDPVDYAKRVEALGVGEILLTSIDDEGSMHGYDLDLTMKVSQPLTCQ